MLGRRTHTFKRAPPMTNKDGGSDGLLDTEPKLSSSHDARDVSMSNAGKDTTDQHGISTNGEGISDASQETVVTLHDLLSEAESRKDRGNVEFYKGKVLAKHTAGKNFLRDACILYAEGLQALSQADDRLDAERLLLSQQAPRSGEEDQQRDLPGAADNHDQDPNPSGELPATQENTASASADSVAPSPTSLSLLASLSKRADEVRPSLYLNLAACNLLLQEWTPAIACCTHVLDECCGGDALRVVEVEAAAGGGQGVGMAAGAGGGRGKHVRAVAATTGDAGASSNGSASTSTSGATDSAGALAVSPATTAAAAEAAASPVLPTRAQQHRQGEDGEPRVRDSGRRPPCDEGVARGEKLGATQAGEEEREAGRSRRREIAAKALYRRAAAHVGGGDFTAAREDLVRALRLKPRDAAIGRELRKAEKKLAEDAATESLRRETEEGKRRRQQAQQQQQQQQRKHTPAAADKATDASHVGGTSAGARQQAPPAAPRADHAVVAGGAGDSPDSSSGMASGGGKGQAEEQPEVKQGQQQREREEEEEGGRSTRREGCEEEFPTENGGVCRDGLYAWNQSVREVQVCVKTPDWARASDLRVDIRRKRLSVSVVPRTTTHDNDNDNDNDSRGTQTDPAKAGAVAGAGAGACGTAVAVVLAGELSRPVQVDECLWTVEDEWPGRVLLYLQKELPPSPPANQELEPGVEWWASVMEGDPEVDVSKCDAGSDASKYPEHVRRRGAKALWEHQKKTPEEKLKEERMREARRQMEEEAEERQRDLENALKDPKKAELYRQLTETMPGTSISIK